MLGHEPVMLEETLDALTPQPGERILDGTLGLGGHAERILEAIGPEGRLLGLDRDASLLERASERLARFGPSFRGVHAPFSLLETVARGSGLVPLDGLLLDLGVCSVHLDDPERGFSFAELAADAPLDMRLDQSRGESARQLLDRVDEAELVLILQRGDVPAAKRIAQALLEARPLRRVGELTAVLQTVRLPRQLRRRHHPATLVFQALRIAVNHEAEELRAALDSSLEVLAPGGRLAVLSYHSGEDRVVKRFFDAEVKGCICPPALPVCGCGREPRLTHIARGTKASEDEVARNPRARSARLRAGARL